MTYLDFVADFAIRLDLMDQRCSEVEGTISDLRESLTTPFVGLNTP